MAVIAIIVPVTLLASAIILALLLHTAFISRRSNRKAAEKEKEVSVAEGTIAVRMSSGVLHADNCPRAAAYAGRGPS